MVRALVERLRACGSDGTDIEAKASVTELPKSIRETVSAFANGSGGTVLLGVAEEEGFTVVGVDDPVAIRDALTSACTEVVTPPVRAEIEIVDYEGRAVVVAVVPEIARTEGVIHLNLSYCPGVSQGRALALEWKNGFYQDSTFSRECRCATTLPSG